METIKFVIVLILYCVCVSTAYPSRPLNERSPDLTWQAWLLVDDQNQNQNKQQTNSDGVLRRRITPKSVFIAPTFTPDSLPACADGYSSDPMGRCIKIIKLDQDTHYKFLIEKLKQKFGSLDYDDEEEEEEEEKVQATGGPFQLNIPLNVDDVDLDSEENDQETDVAIIVSPTKPDFDFKTLNFNKRDSLDDEMRQEMLLKKLAETTTEKVIQESTTITEHTTTDEIERTTTVVPEMEGFVTVTDEISTVDHQETTVSTKVQDLQADSTGFSEPTTTTNEPTTVETQTPESKLTTQSPKPEKPLVGAEYYSATTYHPKFEFTTTSPKPDVATYSSFVRFPAESKVQSLVSSFVKFPDSEVSFKSEVPPSVEHVANSRGTNYHDRTDRPVVFRGQEFADLDYTNGVQNKRNNFPSAAATLNYNRRNRDKHNSLFLIPPRWNPSNFQKPLVLRFSRKHSFVDTNQFKNPDYYRSIPSDDFAYLFKFKHRLQNRR